MKRIIIIFTALISALVIIGTIMLSKEEKKEYINFSDVVEYSTSVEDKDVVRIGLISVTGDNRGYLLEKGLANYIGEKLEKNVKLIQKKSYKEINTLLKNDQIDVAFLSTGAYSLYEDKNSLELLARPNRGKAYYHPVIITRSNSDIENIDELKGKTFAFVDTYSYSGYLALSDYLKKHGTTVNKFFESNFFTHSHEESINQIINGGADAAIIDDWALQYLENTTPAVADEVKVIMTFPEVATGPVVTHKNYKEKEKIKKILLEINKDSSIKDVLNQLQIEKYEETSPEDYPNLIGEE